MTALVVVLGLLLVLAVVAMAVWLWASASDRDQVGTLIQIRVEEQLALWRLQTIRRQTQAEMRRIRDAYRPRSLHDRKP